MAPSPGLVPSVAEGPGPLGLPPCGHDGPVSAPSAHQGSAHLCDMATARAGPPPAPHLNRPHSHSDLSQNKAGLLRGPPQHLRLPSSRAWHPVQVSESGSRVPGHLGHHLMPVPILLCWPGHRAKLDLALLPESSFPPPSSEQDGPSLSGRSPDPVAAGSATPSRG